MASKHNAQVVQLYVPRKHFNSVNEHIAELVQAAGGMSTINDVAGTWVSETGGTIEEPVRILHVISTEQNWQPVAEAVRELIKALLYLGEQEVLSLVQAGGELFKVVNTQEDLQRLSANA